MILQIVSNSPNWAEIVQAYTSIISVFGFAIILATLYLQQMTFAEQQKITKIEQKRFQYEIRPLVKLLHEVDKNRIKVVVENHDALNVIFTIFGSHDELQVNGVNFYNDFTPRIPKDLPFYLSLEHPDNLPPGDTLLELEIYFSDEVGTLYRQLEFFAVNTSKVCYGPVEVVGKEKIAFETLLKIDKEKKRKPKS